MKRHAGAIVLCAAMLCGGAGRAAELLGSPVPEVRKNFNRLLITNTCPRCDLRGVVLNRIDLFGADLSGADLSGAQLGHASLAGANLRHANLRGAWLGGADLSGTDMTGADLEGADFSLNKSSIPSTAQDDDNAGWHAAAAAAGTVNSMLDQLFARSAELSASPPAQDAAPQPPFNGMSASAEPAVDPPKRSVDEIPVIEPMPVPPLRQSAAPRFWERIWLDSAEKDKGKNERKKTAPTDGSRQPVPAEGAGQLVAAPMHEDVFGAAVAARQPQQTVR